MSGSIEDRLAALEHAVGIHSEGHRLTAGHLADHLAIVHALGAVLAAMMAPLGGTERARIRTVALAALDATGGNAAAAGLVEQLTAEPVDRSFALLDLPGVLQ